MKRITQLTTLIAALAALSARAQVETLVTGTNALDANSAVINLSSNSYAILQSADSQGGANLFFTMQGIAFSNVVGQDFINGYTFTGPATIQVQGNIYFPSFTTFDITPLRKAVGTNIQTLVVNPANTNSATVNVPSNSIAIIPSAATQSSANLLVAIQGVALNAYPVQNISVNGMMFAGPATVQLQGDIYGPSFATVEVVPIRKSFRKAFQTLIVTPSNTNSATINVSSNSYATITSADPGSSGTLVSTVQGIPISFYMNENNVLGFTFAGPATIQFQGDSFNPSFITVATPAR